MSQSKSNKKGKGKKKKKKKKATQLAAIGEDLLDSPVQSADEDDVSNNKVAKSPAGAGADHDNSNSKVNDDAATNS